MKKCDIVMIINAGAIDITYMAANGSVGEVIGDTSFATVGMDFSSEEQTVRLEDGEQSAAITIPIIDVSLRDHILHIIQQYTIMLIG